MEHLPPRQPDEEPHGHEGEQLYRGEIDMTGVVRQDDALVDVISDAIAEAEADDGQLPGWGARTMARALANERDEPLTGALHRFAITGQAAPEAITAELAELHEHADDPAIQEWINWLGTYVSRPPATPEPTTPADIHEPADRDLGTSADNLFARLHQAFAQADACGEPIAGTDARTAATVLSIFLDADSEMARFAETGDANPVLLSRECQTVKQLTELAPGAESWVEHFEQYLASHSDLGRHDAVHTPPAEPVDPVFGTPLERVSAYFQSVLAQADARGEPIAARDAQAIATVLAAVLGPTAQLRRFAETGDGDPPGLRAECRYLKGLSWSTPGVRTWIEHFERYLDGAGHGEGHSDAFRDGHDDPEVQRGISAHGDAFRAYLQLPDRDAPGDDALEKFQAAYLGTADSIPQLLAVIREKTADAGKVAGIDPGTTDDAALERAAHLAYDIVECNGELYLFSK
jgi:hypothetical protein